MNKHQSKTAVVTGAGSGIGRATAVKLAESHDHVAVTDIDEDGASETCDLIAANGGSASPIWVDVTDRESIQALVSSLEEESRTISTVVNNAGWDRAMPFLETEPDFWERVVGINYLGPVAVTHALLPQMIGEGRGHVINVGSDAGRVGSLGETVYAGAKGGVIAFTKSLAREVARYGINVNCVCPGPTDTPLFHEQFETLRDSLVRAIPFRRLAAPEETAHAIAFFSTDEATYITGQVLSVSGGLTMVG